MNDKTKESLNQFLTEWMGECWHEKGAELKYSIQAHLCKNCGMSLSTFSSSWNPDWTSRERFLDLWDKARASIGLKSMAHFLDHIDCCEDEIDIDLIDQPTFAEEWAKFCGWKGDKS